MTLPPDLLLSVRGLTKRFPIRKGLFKRTVGAVHAVNGIDLDIRPGETLGLVGESGSGKTTAGRALIRLVDADAGTARFRSRTLAADGEAAEVDLLTIPAARMKRLRRDIQIVFQDPFSSLNPRLTIGTNIGEPLRAAGVPRRERLDRVAGLLADVGLRPEMIARYPHELSGGQRQRVAIARALALEPQFVVADEPVSALDVSIQAQVLNLLLDLQRRRGLAYLFIAHDLAVVRYMSDRVAVMYLGRIVETAPTDALFADPRHPYTEALIAAAPEPKAGRRSRIVLSGDVGNPVRPPPGCPFHPRCRYAQAVCRTDLPPLREVRPAHAAACHFADTLPLRGIGPGAAFAPAARP